MHIAIICSPWPEQLIGAVSSGGLEPAGRKAECVRASPRLKLFLRLRPVRVRVGWPAGESQIPTKPCS